MKPFLLLYTCWDDTKQYFAEGLIHIDGAVYVRGFYPELGKLYGSLLDMKNDMRDNRDIRSYHIVMLDTTEASLAK